MKARNHEEKILQNIQEISYCTECFLDFLDFALVQYGASWQYLCPRCYHRARESKAEMRRELPGYPGHPGLPGQKV